MFEFFSGLHYLDMLGTVVFAFTGLLAASRKQLDLFGALVIAMVTAVGGGTLRDLILDQPVFWVKDPIYIYVVTIAAIFLFYYARFKTVPMRYLLFLDAIGLAAFTAIGAHKAILLDLDDVIIVMTAVMTGVVGGVIRDVLVGEVPLIFRKEIYATAAFAGASLMLVSLYLGLSMEWSMFIAMMTTFLMRWLAILYNFSLPVFKPVSNND